jgi:hypothetical protein
LDYIRQSEFFDNSDETPNWKNYVELYNHFKNIKRRTLRNYLRELQQLKWLRRHGRDYHLNPFLYQLFWIDSQYTLILEYAPFKIDLFELLNLPLVNALNYKIVDVEINHFNDGGIADEKYYREIFKEWAIITLKLEDGRKAETVLPINLHAQPTKGSDLSHYCIPLPWKLFDIEKAAYYSTNFKRSHHKDADNKLNHFIHFDNSISVHYLPTKQFYMLWQRNNYLRRKISIKYWQNGEYLEFDNYDNLKRLFVERFVNGKRRLDLFNALGMTYKPNLRKPKKPSNKKPKFQPMRIDNMAMYKQQLNSFS